MGYYTDYELTVLEEKDVLSDDWAEQCFGNYSCYQSTGTHYHSIDSIKWYDHEADLIRFSKKYPNTVFVLKGIGEEPGDLWVKYFKNGKIQREKAVIKFDEFDESKLE